MRTPTRGNKTMLLFLVYFFVIQIVITAVILVLGFDLADDFLLVTGVGQVLGLFVPFCFYLLFTKQKQSTVLKWKPLGLENTLLVIGISLSVIPMVHLISYLSAFVFFPVINLVMIDLTIHPMWLSFLVVAIFPSLFEEFMMRGAIYSEYEGVSIKKAAVMTGLFFGIMHLNFHQAIYAGAFGVLYAYILFYTRSIWAPILLHFINNGLAVVLAYSEAYTTWYDNLSENPLMFLLIIGGLSLVLTPVLILCLRSLKQNNEPHEDVHDSNLKIFDLSFWLIIAFFLIYAGLMEIAFRFI